MARMAPLTPGQFFGALSGARVSERFDAREEWAIEEDVTIARGENRCDYVTQRAGQNFDGSPAALDGYGDATRTCGKFGRPVTHTFHVKRPGTTAVYDTVEGTVIRCSEHEATA